jgi:hypothetical protein
VYTRRNEESDIPARILSQWHHRNFDCATIA